MTLRSAAIALLAATGAVACAGAGKSREAPPATAAAPEPRPGGASPEHAAPPPAPPPIAQSDASGSTTKSTTAPGAFAPPPNRSIAMAQASNDVETSQRELDVAGGDCHNACRALGSMDRAAGRLCSLAQSSDEQRRCGDARNRLYSARDKVRNTCGSCPDVSVDRSAPVPSR